MQIALHTGAHSTDEDRLLKSLLKDAGMLAAQGTQVPGPGRYRRLLRDMLLRLDKQPPGPETRDMFLDTILDSDRCERLVLSFEHFVCAPHRVVSGGVLYRLMERRLESIREVFAKDDLELFFAIRNPATFLPAVYGRIEGRSFDEFMDGAHPEELRWPDLLRRVMAALPGVPLTVWCNEDTPLIWEDLLTALGGVAPGTEMAGAHDLLADIMSADGMRRFESYLQTHPPQNDAQRRRITSAFLDKFAVEEAIEVEIDIPGWDEALIERMTEAYEEDLHVIAEMEGLTFIEP